MHPVINAVSFEEDDWGTTVAAVQSGNHPYEVEDTKEVDLGELGVHTLRVANTTSCSEEWMQDEEKSQTACGFVLEFVDIITTHEMNEDPVNYEGYTNTGGWSASEMRTYVNEEIYNALPENLKEGIINTYVVSSHGYGDETGTIGGNKNFGSTDKLYLLSTEEVWVQGESNIIDNDTSRGTSRQLDYYANNNVSTTNYSGAIKNSGESASRWWLHSASFDFDYFLFGVGKSGGWGSYDSSYSGGVSPAFRLAN